MRHTLPLLLVLLPFLPAPAQESRPATRPDKAVQLAREIASEVARLRGLPKKEEIQAATYTVEELKERLKQMLDEEMPAQKLTAHARGLELLGLLPAGYDLRQGMLSLLEEQVAGFYDPASDQLRLVDRSMDLEGAGGLGSLLGSGMLQAEDAQGLLMAHEITHALQDQHFDLEAYLPAELALESDDLTTALHSVPEGDATVTMMLWLLNKRMGLDAARFFAMADRLKAGMKLGGALETGAGPRFAAAPPYLQQYLLFPYLRGMLLCLEAGSFDAVDRIFRKPPLSTEQVLHPAKLLGKEPDHPMVLDLPDLAAELGEDARLLTGNALGELYIRVLLEEGGGTGAARVAAGWDGDRYEVYDRGEGRATLVWLTTWDTPEDAGEFQDAAGAWLSGSASPGTQEDVDWAAPYLVRKDGTADLLVRRGQDVVILLAAPRGADVRLVRKVLEKTRRRERRRLGTEAPASRPGTGKGKDL